MFFVKPIPQDTEQHRSFNVLVPLNIQGKFCRIVKEGGRTDRGGTIGHQICVEGRGYNVPTWAIGEMSNEQVENVLTN